MLAMIVFMKLFATQDPIESPQWFWTCANGTTHWLCTKQAPIDGPHWLFDQQATNAQLLLVKCGTDGL